MDGDHRRKEDSLRRRQAGNGGALDAGRERGIYTRRKADVPGHVRRLEAYVFSPWIEHADENADENIQSLKTSSVCVWCVKIETILWFL